MKTVFRRRTAIAALMLVPALSACDFQTDQIYQPGVGVNERSGVINVLNSVVVAGQDGSGVFAGTLVNTSETKADKLLSISVDGGPEVVVGADVAANGLVNLADAKAPVVLSGKAIEPGGYVSLVFRFGSGQTTTLNTPVVAHSGDYADVTVPGSDGAASTSTGSTDSTDESAH